MQEHGTACPIPEFDRPSLEIADIFREHGQKFIKNHIMTPEQAKAFRAILACRTPALGGHLDVCPHCGLERPSYNSCRNRHCPKCQSLAQARWIAGRSRRILPAPYLHIVFTLPAQLRPLARANPKTVFDILFTAAAQTLLCLSADPNRLGAQPAFSSVLHTWTRDLRFHPHLHCVITAGGLNPTGTRWVGAKWPGYLFPVKVMGALFRGKFLHALQKAGTNGGLRYPKRENHADPCLPKDLINTLYAINWNVYAKRPFGGPKQVFQYLGRYTHRVAISNHRLCSMDGDAVTFFTRGDNVATLSAIEFIRRFLLHVLPAGFCKIRHYGLMAPANVNSKLQAAHGLLENDAPHGSEKSTAAATDTLPLNWQQCLLALTGIDLTRCPSCGKGPMSRFPLPVSFTEPDARGPPAGEFLCVDFIALYLLSFPENEPHTYAFFLKSALIS